MDSPGQSIHYPPRSAYGQTLSAVVLLLVIVLVLVIEGVFLLPHELVKVGKELTR
jgi:hypothetical protein